jgi:putative addiction module antidote
MLSLKIRRVGNSLGVIIPTEALKALQVEEGSTLFLTEAPDGFRVTPYDPDFEKAMKSAEKVMRRYRNALRELAK